MEQASIVIMTDERLMTTGGGWSYRGYPNKKRKTFSELLEMALDQGSWASFI